MVDTSDLGSDAEWCESSSLSEGTKKSFKKDLVDWKILHIFVRQTTGVGKLVMVILLP